MSDYSGKAGGIVERKLGGRVLGASRRAKQSEDAKQNFLDLLPKSRTVVSTPIQAVGLLRICEHTGWL